MLDELDRGLVHALHVDGRAPFARIAAVLGTSTQTVTRRYQRLRADAGLRVVGLLDPHRADRHRWIVRLTAATGTAPELAAALARRPDTSWVRLTSGGTEIAAIVDTAPGLDGASAHSLLLRDIPRTASITAVSAHYILHTYLGGPTTWRGLTAALTDDQERELRPPAPTAPPPEPVPLTDVDRRLLAVLLRDGRAGYAELAAATGRSAATVARRLAELRGTGALFFDLELDDTKLGVTTQALLWLSVPPARLDEVATELAGHDELAVVAATTGRTNLMASALCPTPAALHHYLTRRLAFDAITAIETAPVLRTLKAAGPVR
ncbi:Lrp/AsnC family transcriptional regulator [Pseudonocardia acaciae]|uniref:Lrp/AsnC family transcriptional regulator n=1 Tax=Pseudonocardia acaciae TaxID=551276 RepID=UPI0004907C9B|nr:Lrp/AsnC family transcriptional regulator [Pseudonocardia acaciae]